MEPDPTQPAPSSSRVARWGWITWRCSGRARVGSTTRSRPPSSSTSARLVDVPPDAGPTAALADHIARTGTVRATAYTELVDLILGLEGVLYATEAPSRTRIRSSTPTGAPGSPAVWSSSSPGTAARRDGHLRHGRPGDPRARSAKPGSPSSSCAGWRAGWTRCATSTATRRSGFSCVELGVLAPSTGAAPTVASRLTPTPDPVAVVLRTSEASSPAPRPGCRPGRAAGVRRPPGVGVARPGGRQAGRSCTPCAPLAAADGPRRAPAGSSAQPRRNLSLSPCGLIALDLLAAPPPQRLLCSR